MHERYQHRTSVARWSFLPRLFPTASLDHEEILRVLDELKEEDDGLGSQEVVVHTYETDEGICTTEGCSESAAFSSPYCMDHLAER